MIESYKECRKKIRSETLPDYFVLYECRTSILRGFVQNSIRAKFS